MLARYSVTRTTDMQVGAGRGKYEHGVVCFYVNGKRSRQS